MSLPSPVEKEYVNAPAPPLTFGGWSLFDKVRPRWGGFGDMVLGIAAIGGGHSAGTTVFGVLCIALGITTWVLTCFGGGGGEAPNNWYTAWNTMSTPSRAIAGTGSVIGMLFIYLIFFWFFIARLVWRHIITPSLQPREPEDGPIASRGLANS